jgi:hypothetical protein
MPLAAGSEGPSPRGLPLIEREFIFGNQIRELARQTGRPVPGQGTIEKLTSRASRETGHGPKPDGYLGARPLYKPLRALAWLDGLVTAAPRGSWLTNVSTPAAAE